MGRQNETCPQVSAKSLMSELTYSLYIEIRTENLLTNNVNLNLLRTDVLAGVSVMNWLALAFLIFHSMIELTERESPREAAQGQPVNST